MSILELLDILNNLNIKHMYTPSNGVLIFYTNDNKYLFSKNICRNMRTFEEVNIYSLFNKEV